MVHVSGYYLGHQIAWIQFGTVADAGAFVSTLKQAKHIDNIVAYDYQNNEITTYAASPCGWTISMGRFDRM
jgi:hypothetical protein